MTRIELPISISRQAAVCAAACAVLVACGPTSPGKQPPGRASTPIARMARQSDAVVVGRVIRQSSRWEGKLIVTTADVEPLEWYKGDGRARILRVSHLGGTVGVITQTVSHEPTLEPDEVSVMFLRAIPAGKAGGGTLHLVDEPGRIPVLAPGERVERLKNNVRLRRELDAIRAEVRRG